MIIPGRVHLLHLMHYVGRPLLLHFVWDLLVTLIYWLVPNSVIFPALPVSLIGSAVAVCLSFRNTGAYARWWEARTLWGSVVNSSRSFTRQVLTMLPRQDGPPREILLRHVAYVHALRLHLRAQAPWDELAPLLPADELCRLRTVANVPNAVLLRTGELVRLQAPDSMLLASIESTLGALSNAQGGLERIRNTPFPVQFSTYPVWFTHAFCLLLPLGLVEALGLCMPLGSTAATFLFLALLRNGDDLKNPFGNTENDVPLTTLTRSIEIDVRDSLGEAHDLRAVEPVGGVAW